MKIKDIVVEGFWDNFLAARGSRQAGTPITAASLGMNPISKFFNNKVQSYKQSKQQAVATSQIAQKAGTAWSSLIARHEKSMGKKLTDDEYKDDLQRFLMSTFQYRMTQQDLNAITDQNVSRVVNFIRDTVLPWVQQSQQQAQTTSGVDPITGVEAGAKISQDVIEKVRQPNNPYTGAPGSVIDMKVPRTFTFNPNGYWENDEKPPKLVKPGSDLEKALNRRYQIELSYKKKTQPSGSYM